MKANQPSGESEANRHQKLLLYVLFGGCVMAVIFGLLPDSKKTSASSESTNSLSSAPSASHEGNRFRSGSRSARGYKQTAEEQVAVRLSAFSKNRRDLAYRYAENLGLNVPPGLKDFFDAADAGNWDEMDRIYQELAKRRQDANDPEITEIRKLFPTIQETWGAHESAHSWPAQALLDYGKNVLGSLKPGMVYVGGTDPGRFIPTFLNETSGGENHIVLTQNALADSTYLEYVNFLYGDRFHPIGAEESQRAFQDYLQNAQRRFEHDQQFPDEPKQIRSDENYKNENGRVNISGGVAVMSINELLLQSIRDKNPDLSFALEESFSLPSTYQGATPLGPIIELGTSNEAPPLTSTLAAQSLNNWNEIINRLTSSPDFEPTGNPARAYAHMIVAQGNLFSNQNLGNEAEQAYRLAQQLAPQGESEPTIKLYELLIQNGRNADAAKVLNEFQRSNPDKQDVIQGMLRRNSSR